MEDRAGRWRFRTLELQLAAVFAVLSAVGWAVITGANSSPLGRIGLALIGLPVGALFGFRIGNEYLDSSPAFRGFVHVTGYVSAVALVEAAASGGNGRIDGLIASAIFVPIAWLVGRNWLTKRGDRALAFRLTPILIAGGVLVAAVEVDGGQLQVIATTALVALLGVVARLDQASRHRRVATGEITPPEPRPPLSGWRLWVRVAALLLFVAVAFGLLFGPVDRGEISCGSLTEALELHDEDPCAGEARFQAFGGFVFLVSAGALLIGLLRGRLPPTGRSGPAPPATEPPPTRRRERPLRAADR